MESIRTEYSKGITILDSSSADKDLMLIHMILAHKSK